MGQHRHEQNARAKTGTKTPRHAWINPDQRIAAVLQRRAHDQVTVPQAVGRALAR